MRIGINAQILSDAATGVARYAEFMTQALLRLKSDHSFAIFASRETALKPSSHAYLAATMVAVNSAWKRILWEQTILPLKAGLLDLDIMYYPDHTASLTLKPSKMVITIHDLVPLSMPKTHSLGRRLYKGATIRRSAGRAERIIVDSRSTLKECGEYLDIPESRITVIYCGVDPSMHPVGDKDILARLRSRIGLSKPIILYVGTLERRKNVTGLIKAFESLKRERRVPHALVLVGGRGYGYDEIVAAREKSRVRDDILVTGYLPRGDLPSLYSLADVFVFPSFHEGFGLPPLEAMACGCPVVASNTTSLPEVVGDAGLLVDPNDIDGIADAAYSILSDRKRRNALKRKGIERAKIFSWEKAAKQLLGVFEDLGCETSGA